MRLILPLLLLSTPLTAAIQVQADVADYDGNQVSLQGNVQIDNDMGIMEGESALFYRVPTDQGEHSMLLMERNVTLTLQDGGQLKCDSAEFNGQKKTGEFLTHEENGRVTTMTFVDETNGESHLVTCYGTVHVDHLAGKTTLTSPRVDGAVVAEERVTFRDRMGRVTADDIVLWYKEGAEGLALDKLELIGDVYLLNDAPWDPNETKPVRQYALADRVDYYPDTRKMILTCDKPNRVLYFDQINSLQVSAPALEAWRDENGADAVQGRGDVRFSLLEHEINQMKRLFRIHDAMQPTHESGNLIVEEEPGDQQLLY